MKFYMLIKDNQFWNGIDFLTKYEQGYKFLSMFNLNQEIAVVKELGFTDVKILTISQKELT